MSTARRAWGDLPDGVRQAVRDVIGSDIAHFAPAAGGFSAGGVVGIARTAGGSPLFVKAVPAEHFAAGDYRIEARVAGRLPAAVTSPRLRLLVETEGWILLGYDPVDGRTPPEPWQEADLSAAFDMLATMSASLTPAPPGLAVPSVADRMAGRCDTWRGLRDDGRHGPLEVSSLDAWHRQHLSRLADVEQAWSRAVTGPTLLHFDLRHDNLVVTGDGSVSVVDWGRACVGPAWVDLACLLLESDLAARDPQRLFLDHDLGRTAAPDAVDAFLVALSSYWTHQAALPPVDGAPALRDRQERSRQATVQWLAGRWGPGDAVSSPG